MMMQKQRKINPNKNKIRKKSPISSPTYLSIPCIIKLIFVKSEYIIYIFGNDIQSKQEPSYLFLSFLFLSPNNSSYKTYIRISFHQNPSNSPFLKAPKIISQLPK